ncbi:MAG: hypothetical protein VYD70_03105 [Planctomycetota bacterium]|nr:hypothetical protein [Planctomycetota bacterium]
MPLEISPTVRFCAIWLLLASLVAVTGCAVVPVGGGTQAGVFQVFEPHGKLSDTGVGFAGYWFRDHQVGTFLHVQTSYSGSVTGVHHSSLPAEGVGDPVTARERNGVIIAIGPTWKVNEKMTVYGGLGIGFSSQWTERFDVDYETASDPLSPTGYYHYKGDKERGFHATFGSLLQLGGGWIVDLGYGSYGDAAHVGLGYSY